MLLPHGITGFDTDQSILLNMDSKQFRALCYNVSLQKNVTLLTICEASYPSNYLCAKFAVNEQPVQILLNAYYPYVTSTIIAEEGHLVFCELPKELQGFEQHYQLVSKQELNALINPYSIEQLSDIERAQINNWSPRNIGEVIFNTWD